MTKPLNPNIRPVKEKDLTFLKKIIDSTDMFPSDLLDEMMLPYFKNDNETEFWITYEENKRPVAIAYFAPERMTNGTYNLYLIAVHIDYQGKRIGEVFLKYIEDFLRQKGERILLVETSGLPSFERTRNFYLKNQYQEEARIREFYDAGEDKVVFWKSLVG